MCIRDSSDSVEQVRGLTESLRKLCLHHPVIAVDQEGGRVVRTASCLLYTSNLVGRSGAAGGLVTGAQFYKALRKDTRAEARKLDEIAEALETNVQMKGIKIAVICG